MDNGEVGPDFPGDLDCQRLKPECHGQKVCEGCGAVVASVHDICPACHAYRFDESPGRVGAALAVKRLSRALGVEYGNDD